MQAYLPAIFAAAAFAVRGWTAFKLWSLPRRNGDQLFLGRQVGADFYEGPGKALMRGYRQALLVELLIDAPLAVWLIAAGEYRLLLGEQFVAMVLMLIANNLIVSHFSFRALAFTAPEDTAPAQPIQLSMSPRRLRDHTHLLVELVIVASLLGAVALAVQAHAISTERWVTWNTRTWLRSVDLSWPGSSICSSACCC